VPGCLIRKKTIGSIENKRRNEIHPIVRAGQSCAKSGTVAQFPGGWRKSRGTAKDIFNKKRTKEQSEKT